MILTIGNSGSLELDAFNEVKRVVEESGIKMVLFSQDKCLEGQYLHFEVNGGIATYYITIEDIEYKLSDFSAVWYLKPHLPESLLRHPNVEYRQFIHKQFYELRSSLWSICDDKRWVSDPWAIHKAENKIFQLKTALECGFLVPETLVTSDPERAMRFYENARAGVIFKALGVSALPDRVLYTNRLDEQSIENLDALRLSPVILQHEIVKEYELRITVVDQEIFAARIDSQKDPLTALDWRKQPVLNDFDVRMESCDLPTEIEARISKYMERLGLMFGCIDMIVTPDDEYVFLEINPNGQWYFVQLHTGLDIARRIAISLTG